jgi:hypothetical protein
MAKKPFDIGTRQFSMKKEAKAFFSAMLGRYTNGETVGEQDARDLRGLLGHHTEYVAKIGVGIARFEVNINKEYEQVTRSFWIIRTDGSKDDFSFHHCITPKKH